MDIEEFEKEANKVLENESYSWIKIQAFFDKLHNIDYIFYFLRMIVAFFNLCSNMQCSIYSELLKVDRMREKFEDYSTIEEINIIVRETKKKKLLKEYKLYRYETKSVISIIFAMKTTNDTKFFEVSQNSVRFLKVLETMNKSNLPFNAEIGGAVNKTLEGLTYTAGINDKEVESNLKKLEELTKKQKSAKIS